MTTPMVPGPFSLLRFTAAPALYCLPEWWPSSLRRSLPRQPGSDVLALCSATLLRRAGLDGSCEDASCGSARAAVLSTSDFDRLTTMLGALRRRDAVVRHIDATSIREVQRALGDVSLGRLLTDPACSGVALPGRAEVSDGTTLGAWLRIEGIRALGEAAAGWSRDVRVRAAFRVPRSVAKEWRSRCRGSSSDATAAVEACLGVMVAPRWL
jgi:hypothetical protein